MTNLKNELAVKYISMIMNDAIKENAEILRNELKEYEYTYNDFVKDSYNYCIPLNIKLELGNDFEKEEVYTLFQNCLQENSFLNKISFDLRSIK